MYLLRSFSMVLATGLLFVCSSEPDTPKSSDPETARLTVAENMLASSDNQFGLKMFKQLAAENQSINIFISPLSISAALAMVYNGAEGDTKTQMKTALGFDDLSDDQINQSFSNLKAYLTSLDSSVTMEIANSIWHDTHYTFKQDFITTNRKYYDAEIATTDFAAPSAADQINAWVDSTTHGKITEIVKPPLDPAMVMMLINAIYFKGIWTHQFAESLTKDDYFSSQAGEKQQIKMMAQKVSVPYFESTTMQAVDLPYGEGRFAMTIILPAEGTEVNSILSRLTDSGLTTTVGSMNVHEGNIQLPRFKIEYETTLNSVLEALGIKDAFVANTADFSRINGARNLYISEVKHKTYVDVNEEGTEAAAVTSIGIRVTSVGPAPFEFKVDRPFVFVIRERASNAILFIGRICDLSS